MCNHTVVSLVWSLKALVVGDELTIELSERNRRKGKLQYFLLNMPLADSFLKDEVDDA
jgi:hypothetical protein